MKKSRRDERMAQKRRVAMQKAFRTALVAARAVARLRSRAASARARVAIAALEGAGRHRKKRTRASIVEQKRSGGHETLAALLQAQCPTLDVVVGGQVVASHALVTSDSQHVGVAGETEMAPVPSWREPAPVLAEAPAADDAFAALAEDDDNLDDNDTEFDTSELVVSETIPQAPLALLIVLAACVLQEQMMALILSVGSARKMTGRDASQEAGS
eukprot:COSAG01_NODE_415_length_17322_cov_14.785926_10_plen_215_part_00